MMKWIALALVLSFGCKKDASEPAATGSGNGNSNGSADWAQRRHKRLEEMREKLDADHDGKLTPAELGAAQGRMKFDDPAAVDVDHDGNITLEELEAAVKARRHRGSDAGSGSANPAGGDDEH